MWLNTGACRFADRWLDAYSRCTHFKLETQFCLLSHLHCAQESEMVGWLADAAGVSPQTVRAVSQNAGAGANSVDQPV